ncbi:TonB-dependent receptor [soil metagenome]
MKADRVSTVFHLVVCLALAAVPATAAQELPGRGTIAGEVVDATSTLPIEGATVVLEPVSPGLLPPAPRQGSAFLPAGRSTVTGAQGRYRFEGVAPGEYRLRVQRLGYQSASVEIELRSSADSRVSVGLKVEPVALAPVQVDASPQQPFGRARSGEAAEEQAFAHHWRAQAHLGTDTREITYADVVESVTLAETDLFRALQRLPGVSTRDDYAAELWVRGAPWDQTRVYLDGLPLFNPLHAFGAFSGLAADAVGAALLHAGVRPARLGEGAAGVVELKSRRGESVGEARGLGELSVVSARLALDWRAEDDRRGVMASGRRSYFDLATRAAGWMLRDEELRLPYHFTDVTLRTDHRIGRSAALEFSTLYSFDEITGDIPDLLHRTDASWGNGMARVTLAAPLRGLESRHTLGFSGASSATRWRTPDPLLDERFNAPDAPPSFGQILYGLVAGEWAPAGRSNEPAAWSAGYEFAIQDASYRGPPPQIYSDAVDPLPVYRSGSLFVGALWGERRWSPTERLALQTGLRVDAGDPVQDEGALRAAPRLSLRYRLHPELAFSAGAARSYQYVQSFGATGPRVIAPQFTPGRQWLLAGRELPPIRADVATLGAEGWVHGWLAAANLYLRRSAGVAVPDPTPGEIRKRGGLSLAENQARGIELSARRLAGRWTASLGYASGVSELEAEGLRYPAPADRRHTFDATSMFRAGGGLRLGAAFSYASGAPFTRFFPGSHDCRFTSIAGTSILIPQDYDCTWTEYPRVEGPNAERAPAYASLDVLLDWQRRFRGWEMGVFLQLRNALNRDNTISYSNTVREYCAIRCGTTAGDTWGWEQRDEFLPGMPILPLFGVRVAF